MADRVAEGRGSSEALNFLGLGTTVGASVILVSLSADASPFAIAGGALTAAAAILESCLERQAQIEYRFINSENAIETLVK